MNSWANIRPALPPARRSRGGASAAADQPHRDVEAEGEARHPEADRIGREVGDRQPDPGDRQRQGNRERQPGPGRAVICCAVAAGVTSRAKTSRAPVISRGRRDRQAEQQQEDDRERPRRHPGGAGDLGVDGGEEQRPPDRRQREQGGERDPQQRRHLPGGDAEEGAEEQRLEAGELAAVEVDEEEAEAEAEGLDRADRRRLAAARRPAGAADRGEDERPEAAGAEVAERQAAARPGSPPPRPGRRSPRACGRRRSGGAGP